MSTKRVFVIRNQLNQYLDKHSGWQSGKDTNALFRADFHDQALNTLFEINSKDINLRGKILEVDMDDKKRPIVEVSTEAIALDNNLSLDESAEEITNTGIEKPNDEDEIELQFFEPDEANNTDLLF